MIVKKTTRKVNYLIGLILEMLERAAFFFLVESSSLIRKEERKMHFARSAKRVLSGTVIVLIFVGILGAAIIGPDYAFTEDDVVGPRVEKPVDQRRITYTLHDPIHINGDSDFDTQAKTNGWAGDGLSESTPYIIEGYEIHSADDGTDWCPAISIISTTRYFVVRDCLLVGKLGVADGVYLDNAQNGIAKSNEIHDCQHGVFVNGSANIDLMDNTIYDCSESGVRAKSVLNGVDVWNNSIYDIGYNAIWLGVDVRYSVIFNNTISGTNTNGVFLDGREASSCTENHIDQNRISGCMDGILLGAPTSLGLVTFNVIENNTITSCSESGISVIGESTTHNDFIWNVIENNTGHGFYLSYSTSSGDYFNNTIRLNLLDGVYCNATGSFNRFEDNMIANNLKGIYLKDSNYIDIYDNDVVKNDLNGIVSEGQTSEIQIISNTISNNHGHGIFASGGSSWQIDWNIISGHTLHGISLSDCDDIVIHNSDIGNNVRGLSIDNCTLIDLSDNKIERNEYGIFIFGDSNEVDFTLGIIRDSTKTGFRIEDSSFVTLHDSGILNSTENGVELNSSHDITFNNVTVGLSGMDGILSNHCENCTFQLLSNWNHPNAGLRISDSSSNLVNNSYFYENDVFGVCIENSSVLNNVTHSYFWSNPVGISAIHGANETVILNNSIHHNRDYGIQLNESSNESTIKWNAFINNGPGDRSQGYDNGSANLIEYNYWNDWTTPDENSDGIVDLPYSLDGMTENEDPYPLTEPGTGVEFHYLTPTEVMYPNGGELVYGNITITWIPAIDTLDHEVTYTLYYSNNTGTDWYEIAADLTESSWEWNSTTAGEGTNYLVLVVANCTEGLTINDTSDDPFEIREHTLSSPTVTYPNGGEVLHETVTITWSMSEDSYGHDVSYSVNYSSDSGSSWNEIVSGLDTTSYDWDISSMQGLSTYRIMVIANGSCGLSVEDVSDSDFEIKEHYMEAPRLLYPNGFENINKTALIRWDSASDSWEHDITYTLSWSLSGGPWTTIVEDISETEYLWDTSDLDRSNGYRIRVEAECSEGLISSDTSDDFFELNQHFISIPEILNPAGGSKVSGELTIEWTESVDSWGCEVLYDLNYSSDGGFTWHEIAVDVSETQYLWDTSSLTPGSDYMIRLRAHCELGVETYAESEAFTIEEPATTTTTTTSTTTTTTTETTTTTTTGTETTTTGVSPPAPMNLLWVGIIAVIGVVGIIIVVFLLRQRGIIGGASG